MKSSAHSHSMRAFKFAGQVRCTAGKRCQTDSTHVLAYTVLTRIQGVAREVTVRKPFCERHARLFAFKKSIKIQGLAA